MQKMRKSFAPQENKGLKKIPLNKKAEKLGLTGFVVTGFEVTRTQKSALEAARPLPYFRT